MRIVAAIMAVLIVMVFEGCAAVQSLTEELFGIEGVKEAEYDGNTLKCEDIPDDPDSELCTITRAGGGKSVTIQRRKR